MQKFEYKVEMIEKGNVVDSSKYEAELNKFGAEGWEIISVEYAEKGSKPYSSVLMKRVVESVEVQLLTENLPVNVPIGTIKRRGKVKGIIT